MFFLAEMAILELSMMLVDTSLEIHARLWFGLLDALVCLFAGQLDQCGHDGRLFMIDVLSRVCGDAILARLIVHMIPAMLVLVLVIVCPDDQRYQPPPRVYYNHVVHPKEYLTQQVGN